MIELKDLEFGYPAGDFVLRVSSLSVDQGSAVAIIGPSGVGKTTLLNLVAGIALPRHGTVRVGDTDIGALGERARRAFRIANIGMVFQEFELLGYMSVLDNILLPYRITGALDLTREVRLGARRLAEKVGIGDKLKRLATRLSQGERQRVAVCRALLPQPKVLLADEPTGNLDPANSKIVLDILFDYARANSATLLAVTHDHGLIDRFDRTIDLSALAGPTQGGEA